MDEPPAPDAERLHLHTAFLVSARGTADLSPDQVRDRRFVAPSRGVRYPRDANDAELARTAAAFLAGGPGVNLCDVTAAARWGLPLPPWIALRADETPVGLAVTAGGGRPQRRGVRGRRLRLPTEHVIQRDGMTITTPARTWVDCAEFIPVEHVVAMGDVILRRRLAGREDLTSIVRWARGRRGVLAARGALPVLDPGAASPGESLARATLVLAGVPRPECNADIVHGGQWLARGDLVWRQERVIAEYDGAVHLAEKARRHDALRRNLLQDHGWLVIVFTAADLRTPERMVTLVRTALRRRSPSAEW